LAILYWPHVGSPSPDHNTAAAFMHRIARPPTSPLLCRCHSVAAQGGCNITRSRDSKTHRTITWQHASTSAYIYVLKARREQLSPEYKQRLRNWNGLDSRRVVTGPRSAPRHTPCSSIRGLHHQAPRPHRDHATSKSAVKVQTLHTQQGSTNETTNRQQTQTKRMEATFYSALLPHARRPSGYSDMARHRPT